MKYIIICYILFLNLQTLDLDIVRNAYKEAGNDKTKVDSFDELLATVNKQSKNELVAYKGAAIALKAKYANTIKEKKDGFTEGVGYVELAIKNEPNSIETRFIRLSIQENSPKLLKYKSNIEEDKLFISKQFKNITSPSLKKHIKDYILGSKAFTDEEKNLILAS